MSAAGVLNLKSSERETGGGGVGKENKVPKALVPPNNKRGTLQKMDSLAASSACGVMKWDLGLEKKSTTQLARKSNASTGGVGGGGASRIGRMSNARSSLESMSILGSIDQMNVGRISECSLQSVGGAEGTKVVSAKHNTIQQHQQQQGDIVQSLMNCSFVNSTLVDESNISTSSSVFTENKSRKNRRRERCNHPVSSLVQNGQRKSTSSTSNSNNKRGTGISSLMVLPSSTEKPKHHNNTMVNRSIRNVSKSSSAKSQMQEVDACDSLINDVEAMKLGDTTEQQQQHPNITTNHSALSSPKSPSFYATIRHRALPGGCTSPPGFLHRISTVSSNSNIFQKISALHSPMPGNTNPRKRMDKKKTPDKITGMAMYEAMKGEASPLVTELDVTPRVIRRRGGRRRESLNECGAEARKESSVPIDVGDVGGCSYGGNEDGSGNDDAAGADISMTPECGNPRDFLSSPVAHPNSRGGEDLLDARADLFSASIGDQKRISGSSVLEVELPTPRVFVPSLEGNEKSHDDVAETFTDATKHDGATKKKKSKQPKKNSKKAPFNAAAPRTSRTTKDDAPISKKLPPKETKPEVIGTRRSARESKTTDRLTVATWNVTSKDEKKVRFDNDASLDEMDVDCSIDDPFGENVEPPPPSMAPHIVATSKASKSKSIAQTPRDKSNAQVYTDGQWSASEVNMLRNAQKDIDPTLSSYWEEVATFVGSKTSSECREKWFSLVATPKGRPRKESKKKTANTSFNSATIDGASVDEDEEDDLFNSTPLREAAPLDAQNEMLVKKFDKASFGLSACKPSTHSNLVKEGTSDLKDRRRGYKTYIDNLRKDLNPNAKIAKKKKQPKPSKASQNVYLDDSTKGGLVGKLLPDGSFKIDEQEESDNDEDDFFDDEESD